MITASAAGRVNLIGDHTDYMGGLVLPMAIDLATTVTAVAGGDRIELSSAMDHDSISIALPADDPAGVSPPWGRYIAAVAAELGARTGLRGAVTSTLPIGAGLSSSAALEVASALALGAADGNPAPGNTAEAVELARSCQRAEHAAVGVPSGIMDQLSICAGREGHATLIDCSSLHLDQIELPPGAAIWVIHSGSSRTLVGSAYAERRRTAERAAELVGPLPGADPDRIEALEDPVLRRRARHVRSECDRVRQFADALAADDLVAAGALMCQSHTSLRDDYAVSTPSLDQLVRELLATPGVFGARLTGAGFGGCVVALAEPGADLRPSAPGADTAWRVSPARGTHLHLS